MGLSTASPIPLGDKIEVEAFGSSTRLEKWWIAIDDYSSFLLWLSSSMSPLELDRLRFLLLRSVIDPASVHLRSL